MTAKVQKKTGGAVMLRLTARAVGFASIAVDIVNALLQLQPGSAELGRAKKHLTAALRELSAAAGSITNR